MVKKEEVKTIETIRKGDDDMAKTMLKYFGLEMQSEGGEAFCQRQTEAFLNYVREDAEQDDQDKRCRCAVEDAEDLSDAPEEIKREIPHNDAAMQAKEQTAPEVDWDVVAIYDNAGIPSIMHRFKRVTNAELFSGSEEVHPAFVIGGDVYDEIYISVYPNTMINGKPYSLPYAEPVTNITMDDFAEACFAKGDGWHCLTAAEWGLLANISAKLGTLPHGNTDCGKYHADKLEMGKIKYGESDGKTLAGSGPATWTHDHTPSGVHDLCGNIWEFCRGCRIVDGSIQAAENNNAALPETDLSKNGTGWKPVIDDSGKPIFGSVCAGSITFTTEMHDEDYGGCAWGDVKMLCESEQMKELALYAGEPGDYCYVDSTEGEYILFRGGYWRDGGDAGVFYSVLGSSRSNSSTGIGGRSAYFRKR